MNRTMSIASVLAIVTILLYSPVAHHEFLTYDDSAYITDNPHVSSGLNRENIVWAFTVFHEGNWHPVTWISHMLDCQLVGLNPRGHHLENVVIHAINAVLLFILLRTATGAIWRSCIVAAIFAIHPLNVETVAWIAERKSLLSMLFSLLTLGFYGWYCRKPNWKRYLLVVVGFAFAVMAKPMAVTLPLIMLLLDYWPLRRDSAPAGRPLHLLIEKLPFLAMTAVSCIVTIKAQATSEALSDVAILPLSLRIENALVSYAAYVGKIFWPVGLSPYYPYPESLQISRVAACFGILAIGTAAAVFYWRRIRYVAVGWLIFLIAMLPVIGLVQVGRQAMADRYTYVPCIGLFMIVAWGLSEVGAMAKCVSVIAICALFVLGLLTTNYLRYWQDGVTLFTRASTLAPEPDWLIEEFLADSLLAKGNTNAAFQHFHHACALRPAYPYCHFNMAEILYSSNQLRDALDQYQLARKTSNRKDMTVLCLINSGEILMALGDQQSAAIQLSLALDIDPGNARALALRQRLY